MQEQTIFTEALEKEDPAERAAFLEKACAGDAVLRQRIERLFERHQQGDSFLESPAAALAATIDGPALSERPGTVIGPYKLLQQIGEGGMGTVFMAEQTRPVQRMVALKIIKPGMDSQQVIARFEAERQALALMDHPNIAKVLDAGTTDTGRPYFVMELVKGVPITKFCDERRLTPKQRLELFIPVCQAVQHAHQKGIIHRDLKPSNVLIALYDDKPVPKVIDFGIAKATGQKLTDRTMFTEFGQIVGTLEYMSPEQAGLNQLDIDTRSDIYSLGVILYELLTGSTPLEKKRLKEGAMLEVLRLVREEEPPKPSTRLSATDELPSIAANRGLEPRKLSGVVRGELDWVVMKALEKDRGRRYDTANGLAQDVERYLQDEPVQACPPSTWYRLRKFGRRNRGPVLAASLLLLALVAGIVGTTIGLLRAEAFAEAEGLAKTDALEKKTLAENAAKAEREARDALDVARNEKEQQRTRTNLELTAALVDAVRGQEKARTARPGDTEPWHQLRATLRHVETLAGSELADPVLVKRVQTLQRELKQEDKDRKMVARLEGIRLKFNNTNFEANTEYNAAFVAFGLPVFDLSVKESAQRIAASPIRDWLVTALDQWAGHDKELCARLLPIASSVENDPWRRNYFDARTRLDLLALIRMAEQPEALAQSPSTLCMLAAIINTPNSLDLLRAGQQRYPADPWLNFALALRLLNMHQKASTEESIGFFRAVLAVRPEDENSRLLLATALRESGHRDEAVAVLREALRLEPQLTEAYLELGELLSEKGDLKGAIAAFRKASGYRAGPRLAAALIANGEREEGMAIFKKIIEDQPNTLEWYLLFGEALLDKKGKTPTDDVAAYRKALEVYSHVPLAHIGLGEALRRQGNVDGAITAYRKAIELHPKDFSLHNYLAIALQVKGDLNGVIALRSKFVEWTPNEPGVWVVRGHAYHAAKQYDKALADHSRALMLDPKCQGAWYGRGEAYYATKQFDKAVIDFSKALEIEKRFTQALFLRASCYQILGERDKALADYSEAIGWGQMTGWTTRTPHVFLCRAKLFGESGQWDKVVADLSNYVKLEPRNSIGWFQCGQANQRLGRWDKAVADYSKAIEITAQISWQNDLAWLLATCPDPKVRNHDPAIKLAREILKGRPNEGRYWQTLGVAHFSAGDWKSTIASLEKSMQLRKDGDAVDWFFLAMANQKLGNQSEARTSFDKAIQWLEKNGAALEKDSQKAEELRRFRSEAEAILEVKKK